MAPPTHLKGVGVAAYHRGGWWWVLPLRTLSQDLGQHLSFSPHTAVRQASHPNFHLLGFRASPKFPPSSFEAPQLAGTWGGTEPQVTGTRGESSPYRPEEPQDKSQAPGPKARNLGSARPRKPVWRPKSQDEGPKGQDKGPESHKRPKWKV